MIGNDVIDLKVAEEESNWRRPGYLDKLFNPDEQVLVKSDADPGLMVWLLWSMKESAYKIIARQQGRRFFAPLKICCQDLVEYTGSFASGIVCFEDQTIPVQSVITKEVIHTVATLNQRLPKNYSAHFSLPGSHFREQREATRKKLLHQYARLSQLPLAELSIQKDELGIPYFYLKNKQQPILISMSHHGHYGGFIISEPL